MIYPKDGKARKLTVGAIWSLDLLHTSLIMISTWNYFIHHFGNALIIDEIPWTLASTIAITAVLTFIVHCFLAWRIHLLLKKNWCISGPIIVMATLRLMAAMATTGEMIKLRSFDKYSQDFGWLFTIGLGLSSAVDCVITITLCYHLRSNRKGTSSLNGMIDSLVIYTFETGALTCIAAILSMIFWLVMPHNRVFLALHFVISKLYANSLLATLNMRVALSRRTSNVHFDSSLVVFTDLSSHPIPIRSPQLFYDDHRSSVLDDIAKLEINVERIIESQVDTDNENYKTPSITAK